jgi:predicted GH43/DUF377 family glycosyl hydrolase
VRERLPITRSDVRLCPDPCRVVTRPYLPADVGPADGSTRIQRLIDRILELPADDIAPAIADVRRRFTDRHDDLDALFAGSLEEIRAIAEVPDGLSGDLRALIGAYFLHEYSIEAAALTNPSIVLAPDQTGTPSGSVRVIVSLRGVGEGHISSIQLRTGLIGPGGVVHIDEPHPPLLGRRYPPLFDKAVFIATLEELAVSGASEAQAEEVHRSFADPGRNPVELALAPLADRFTMQQLEVVLRRFELPGVAPDVAALAKSTIHWLANSNYELAFPARSRPSQRVLFPRGPSESHGMEDARFVRFTRDDGSSLYLGTYTAYDGFHILPQLIETQDFSTFRIGTLSGSAARNKGIALFPRRIGGRYVALARSDAENNYLMSSDHLRVWEETHRIQVPVRPWELIQIGNSGAPIETEAGWLVITHGVGPLRTYALGAMLLDLDDPRKVISHLPDPLLVPHADERDGYVPNVVYSCGQIVHDGTLVIAYGASDTEARFASLPLDTLLQELTSPRASVDGG